MLPLLCAHLNCLKVHPVIREESTGPALCKAARKGDYVHLHTEKREYDCDLNATDDEDGKSPLICASKFGHLQLVNWMVEHDVDPNIVDSENRTALMWSLLSGHLDCTRSLLRNFKETIDVDVQDKDGLTALHILCMKRDMTDEDRHIVEMILGVAKNINSVEKSTGFTCLHYVSRYEHEEIAEQLLRKGASASVVDSVCTLSTNLYPCSLLIILTYKTKLHTERASSASLGMSCKSIEDCKVDMRARFGREFEFQDTRWYDTDDLCFNIRDDRAHTLSCNEGMCSLYLFRSLYLQIFI